MSNSSKKSSQFLPNYYQTDKNKKFLSKTLDEFIQSPDLQRIDGFVGTKFVSNYDVEKDSYLEETLKERENLQLEPALSLKDENGEVKKVVFYEDIIRKIKTEGGYNENIDKIFNSKIYPFSPPIDWDKFVNYDQYYWLPQGPDPIFINTTTIGNLVGQPSFIMTNTFALSNGMKLVFNKDLTTGTTTVFSNTEYIVEGVGNSIKLVDFSKLEPNLNLCSVTNETFDNSPFDYYGFDSDGATPLNPDYITINKSSKDLNPWTRYNRWFHKSVLTTTSIINNIDLSLDNSVRAQRPIIEFSPDIQLYNFGITGIGRVDLIDETTLDPLTTVNGLVGYYVDEVLLEEGYRIIFNNNTDLNDRKKIYKVTFTTNTNVISLVEDVINIDDKDSVFVKYGTSNQGQSYYYNQDESTWVKSQSHYALNQPPLFDVFDASGVRINDFNEENNFTGTKIFGYEIGTGIDDKVLGFPISYNQNLIGISSFIFRNYFETDQYNYVKDNITYTKNIDSYYFKINTTSSYVLSNIFYQGSDYTVPIVQNFEISTSTTTLVINAIDVPISSNNISVYGFINSKYTPVAYFITDNSFTVNRTDGFKPNDYVTIKVETTQTSNLNGYYDVVPSLNHNPFNEKISTLSYSQILDYVGSMIPKIGLFKGEYPGESNLKDFYNVSSFGTSLISNENLISFVQLFLGNEEYNPLVAFKWVSEQYNTFKQNFLRYAAAYNYNNDPVEAVDDILSEIFKNKLLEEPFYRSDMVPYGNSKKIQKVTITNTSTVEIPIADNFDLERLSFSSFLIYQNNEQLVNGVDYTFDYNQASISLLTALSLNDEIEIHYYKSTLGSYVPPTPTKHGLYFKYIPEKFIDNRYVDQPVEMIRGHDGSLIKAYNDYRDDIIIELEKRIYNNIKVNYNKEIFNIWNKIPGAFRTNKFTKQQFEKILEKDFTYWATKNNINFTENTTSNLSQERSYNYIDAVDKVKKYTLNGTYRNIFRFLYDTDRPETHPWECLGFTSKPSWWDAKYGTVYNFFNNSLWNDVLSGIIGDPDNTYFDFDFQRNGALRPITQYSTLEQVESICYIFQSGNQIDSQWEFGDFGPAEVVWRNSSYYPFSLQNALILLYPIEYLSKLFDLSRVSKNINSQIVWTEDNKFLSPKKLLVEGYDVDQISGFGNFLIEYGTFKSANYKENFSKQLKNLDMNLAYKVGGFTTQEKIQIKINAVDPESTSPGLILPKEDYKIKLHESSPMYVLDISGIIIQKLGDKQYSVKGYNRKNLYFNIHSPVYNKNSSTVQVGGKPEKYSEWKPNLGDEITGFNRSDLITAQSYSQKFYKQGQIIRYDDKFYRVKVSHNATKVFQEEFFQRISQLPYTGGVKVQTSNIFENNETIVPYGTVYNSLQDVYSFIIGYGHWLEKQGFIFDFYNNDLGSILDWNYSAKEFLFWSTQNWAVGNLITLSPFVEYIKFNKDNYIVDDIFSTRYEYSLQNADGLSFNKENVNINRENNEFTLRTVNTEDGIFFAQLNLIQKEHVFVFNNTTIFNDTIFERSSGYRQKRMKLSGFRTRNWNGDLSSPGFLLYKGQVSEWQAYKKYNVADVVRYNTKYYQSNINNLGTEVFDFAQWSLLNSKYDDALLPNFEYKINQFEDFYSNDIDNFDVSQQRLAQHLIGYTPRPYLNNIITDPIAQYKFYQGYIREKGTKKVLSNIVKTTQDRDNNTIDILEEWAFRVGEYGGYKTYKELEFVLDEGRSLENPYLITLTDKIFDDNKSLIHYTSSTDILIKPDNFDIEQAFYTSTGTFNKNIIKLLNAGYVRSDDVTSTAYDKNSLLDIANNGIIQNGNTIWVGFLENGDWTVYRYQKQRAKITGVYVSSPGAALTFVTNTHHYLEINDIISVVNFNNQVNGVYKVIDVPNRSQFTVASSIAGVSNEPLLSFGSLFKFEESRYENFEQWSLTKDQFNLDTGSKIWIDKDVEDKWAVYEKIDNFDSAVEFRIADTPIGQKFGFSIFANSATDVVLVGAPSYNISQGLNFGKVRFYKQVKSNLQTLFDIELNYNNNYAATTSTEFGYAVDYDIGKGLVIIGAPEASYVRATTSTSTLICVSSSTFIPYRNYASEGLVKITSKNSRSNGESTKVVIAQPYSLTTSTIQDSRFGHSIYINQVGINNTTTLLVGAPGNDNFVGTGSVFAYKIGLLDVEQLDFDLDTFVSENRGSYSFVDYKNKTLLMLPYYVSNNLYIINDVNRYGLYRDPDSAGLAFWVNASLITGVDGQTEIVNNAFFNALDQNPTTFDYERSFTANKIYQKKGTIDLRSFFTSTIKIISTSSVSLNQGAKWGYALSGDKLGNNIAISAPNYFANGIKGLVQIFDNNLSWKQTITSPLGANDEFGTSLKISSSGKFLFVGSSKSIASLETYGKVVVYIKNNSGLYEVNQIIENPVFNSDLKFGQNIQINDDENLLVISSLGTNKSEEVKFFLSTVSKKGETTFDNGQTRFVTVIPNSGSVYTYQNFNDDFIQADELLPEDLEINGKYGTSLAITDKDIFVGAPSYNLFIPETDISKIYKFKITNLSKKTWNKIRYQEELIEVDKIRRISLIDNLNENLIEYLDIFDPIKGRIPGIAEQELRYKSVADPAIYSIGIAGTVNDNSKNWLDEHVGDLWWDLSTAKYIWYEQGNEVYRKNNWGKLFPGASIDIYEWVRSTLTPSEWASKADTSEGLVKGISGQPKYVDNSVISVKQVLNTVTGAFENVYYFWVKNKTVVPDKVNRRISALEVSRLIADPVAYGLRICEIISTNSITLSNVQSLLVGQNISLNMIYDEINNQIPLHTEWQLLREGDSSSVIPYKIEKKIIDSLVGIDDFGNTIPELGLTYRNRYGLSIRPRQTVFKDRFEAVRNIISFVNSVLLENRIYGIVDFENLNAAEPIPAASEREYDYLVEDRDILDLLETTNFRQAILSCNVSNGVITKINILDSGFGYKLPPKITVTPNFENKTVLSSYIDSEGRVYKVEIVQSAENYASSPRLEVRPHAVLIEVDNQSNNRWSLNSFDYADNLWVKTRTQLYNTPLYWEYVDYVSDNFNQYKPYANVIADLYEISRLENISQGDYIKVLNLGNGRQGILEKTAQGEIGTFSEDWNIVYNEKATIQFSDTLWDIQNTNYGFDKASIDEVLYDQLPNIELKYILTALKDQIFINDLKIYWNLFFFYSVKYALSEQQFLDWAFKTSFVIVKSKTNNLEQPNAYCLDNSQYYEEFVKEVKPYRTKIRNFVNVSNYIENTPIFSTDFDVPAAFDETLQLFLGVNSFANSVNSPLFAAEPYKSWYDNRLFYVKEILIADGGSGYTSPPSVQLIGGKYNNTSPSSPAQAKAYIRSGKVYKVEVIYGGKDYEIPPSINFTGTSYISLPKASVILANDTTRKNLIGIKFDRYSTQPDILNYEVDYTFPNPCDGSTIEFVLPFRADTNKQFIFPTLDKKLVLGDDYRLEEYTEKVDAFTTIYTKFIFVNYVPKNGQIFRVVFRKHNSLFNAVDRVNQYYDPTEEMVGKSLPLLMTGFEYPYTKIQGLEFNYSTPIMNTSTVVANSVPPFPESWGSYNAAQKINWFNINNITPSELRSLFGIDENTLLYMALNGYKYAEEVLTGVSSVGFVQTGVYDNGGGWNDFTTDYIKKKVVSSATINSSTLYLNNVTGISIGQSLNFITTSSQIFRTGTVVTNIITASNAIEISSPRFDILKMLAENNSIGSIVQIDTFQNFHGDVRPGDKILVNGIATGGYDGYYTVLELNGSNSIITTATNALASTSTTFTSASIRVLSILSPIEVDNREIGSYNFHVGPCKFPVFTVAAASPSVMEGYTATFTISAEDLSQVDYGLGRTFGYYLTGTNITTSDFTNTSISLSFIGTVTTSSLSLPITFNLGIWNDSVSESTETLYVNVFSYITTQTASTATLASTSIKLRDRPAGPEQFFISASNTVVNEGESLTYSISGSNVDFGSNGRVFRVVGTGTNITTTDLLAGVLTSTEVILYSADEFPLIFPIDFAQDFLTEGPESFTLNLETWLNVLNNGTSTYSTSTTITILDSIQIPTFELIANSTMNEGSLTTITVVTSNLAVGQSLPFVVSTVSGSISITELTTSSYSGAFILSSGSGPYAGKQIATTTFTATVGDSYEPNDVFRFSLTNAVSLIGLVSGQSYVDIEIVDQVVANFGQSPSNIFAKTSDGAEAFGKVRIRTTGTISIEIGDASYTVYPSSVSVTPATQIWSNNTATISYNNYYVRAIVDPYDTWTNTAEFTGPGFGSTVDTNYFATNGYAPVIGSWVYINSADVANGWYGRAIYDTNGEGYAAYYLTIQIGDSSQNIIASGTYNVSLNSQQSAAAPLPPGGFLANSEQGNDFRDLQ